MKKPIPGYEGRYTVDDNGNVFSIYNNRYKKAVQMESGYYYVHLFDGSGDGGKNVRLHRIVAEVFVPNPNGYKQVNHINGDKSDNSAKNLEWCTQQQNIDHSVRIGLRNHRGESNPSAKLTWDIVCKIRSEYERGSKSHSLRSLAKKYGVTNVMIGKIVRGDCWKTDGFSAERSRNRGTR